MRWIKRIAAAFLLLLAAWGLVIWSELLPRTTAVQRAALGALEAAPTPAGERNAFAWMHFANFDVPESRFGELAEEDVAAFERWLQTTHDPVYESTVTRALEPLPAMRGEEPALCVANAPGCLARVAADPQATHARLGELATLARRSRELARFDHYRSGYPPSFPTPLPQFLGVATLVPSDVALRFVEGDRAGAMADLCDYTAGWRRLRARADSLLVSMVGAGAISHAAHVFGEMLAALPAGEQPPGSCAGAFARLDDAEVDQCAVMAMEFRTVAVALERSFANTTGTSWSERLAYTLLNREHTRAVLALNYGRYCQDDERRRRHARSETPVPPLPPPCSAFDTAFNPVGCIVVGVAMPDFDGYWHRLLDLDDRLRLVEVITWLRSQPGDAAAALEYLPVELRFERLQTNPAERWIEVDLRQRRGTGAARIPLPPPASPSH